MDTWPQDGLSVSTHNEGFYNIIMYGNVSRYSYCKDDHITENEIMSHGRIEGCVKRFCLKP
jgi:hypothetical protein